MHGRVGPVGASAPRAGAAMLRKLSVRSAFTEEGREVLLAMPMGDVRAMPREDIVAEGEALTRACLLLDGMACRYKRLPDGSRQIVSFHTAGDIVDLHCAVLKVADHGIAALGPARAAYLPHEALAAAIERHRGIAWAFWRETLVDGSILREWLLNIGRREAYARLAHLFCEMMVRADAVGLSRGRRFPFPVSQAELGDATGLTPVHVNRTMQKLRADGLISTCGTDIVVEDWNGLVEEGSFDPGYLHLPQ